jgi:uncharacterized protein
VDSFRTLFAALLLLCAAPPSMAQSWPSAGMPPFPPLSGPVVDEAHLLPGNVLDQLSQKLAAYSHDNGTQVVVVTLPTLRGYPLEDYGYQLGRHWGIGQKGKNNGVLLIVDAGEKQMRIEVGYGLEGTLTDAVSKLIIENAIIPRFRANDVPGGVTRGVDDIISVLTGDAEEWKQRAAKRPDPELPWGTILILILALAMFAVVFAMIVGAMPSQPRNRRRRSASPWSSDPWWTGSSGGFSGGGFSGGSGGFGGGGFGGGGGSFGGGGASGSW